eukprot:9046998-Karenia_brevis.AAC.1
MDEPEIFSAPTATIELNADNIDEYPEYHSVVHGTNHHSAVRIKAEQRLRTTTRLDNHLGKRISRSPSD